MRPPKAVARVLLNRRVIRSFSADLIARYRNRRKRPRARYPAATYSAWLSHARYRGDRGAGRRESGLRTRLRSRLGHRSQLMEVRNRGATILLVSEDLDELFKARRTDPCHV